MRCKLGQSFHMRTKPLALLMAATALMAFANLGHSQTWNSNSQWSPTSNPNGAWSYGRRLSVTGDGFDLMPSHCDCGGGPFWLLCPTCYWPSIQGSDFGVNPFGVNGPALWAYDNSSGYPVVRWTCPTSGTYTVACSFNGVDPRGVNVQAWIVTGGSPEYSVSIQGGGFTSHTNTQSLQAGAYLDFVVAWNGGTPAAYNWTEVDATITFQGPLLSQVTSACDGSPIAGASVQIGSYSAISDSGGNYTISNVPPGTYTAIVSASNYLTLTNTVTFPTGISVATNDFSLYPTAATVEFIDPNPLLLDASGNVVTDADSLATLGDTVTGATADGVTPVLLRVPAGSDPVTFSLTSFEDGGLTEVGGTGPDTVTSVTVPTQLSGGTYWAFAIYWAPLDFCSTPTNVNSRTIQIQVSGACGGGGTTNVSFQLWQPPVVLIHGVWDTYKAWTNFVNYLSAQEGANVCIGCNVDYGMSQPAPDFDPLSLNNYPVMQLENGVTAAVTAYRNEGIADTQVDVIGHSMGGLVARSRVRYPSPLYNRAENFNQGDFHKLITVGTPHQGTPLANVLIENKCNYLVGASILVTAFTENPLAGLLLLRLDVEQYAALSRHPIGPAIYGFQPNSAALADIGATPVPTHAIVGVAPALSQTEIVLNSLLNIGEMGATVDGVLGGVSQHDTIVPIPSQRDCLNYCLNGLPTTEIEGVVHAKIQLIPIPGVPPDIGETGSMDVWNEIIRLLREPISSGDFASCPPLVPNGSPIQPYVCPLLPSQASLESQFLTPQGAPSGTSISLTPADGTVVQPGASVTVTLSVTGGNAVSGTLFAVGNMLYVTNGPLPASFTYTVDNDAVGAVSIQALTYGAGPTNYYASTSIVVQPSAELNSISVTPQSLNFNFPSQMAGLIVLGNYGDGIQRDITSTNAGTSYSTASGSNLVVSLGTNGAVTAVSNGVDSIIISNSGVTTSVVVNVQISNFPPIPAPISNQTIVAGTLLNIPIDFTDPSGNAIRLSASSLPSFVTLTDYGDGTGLLQVSPTASTSGTFYITVVASNNGTPSLGAAVTFVLTISPQPPFQILSIQRQGSDALIAWTTFGGANNVVQAANGAADGSYSNNFADIGPDIIIPGISAVTTNYLDVGGFTNRPARYYRVAMVPPESLVVNPGVLNFASIPVGATTQQTFVVSDTRGKLVTNGLATVTGGPFSIVSGGTFTVPAGGSTNIVVQFVPSSVGGFTNSVIFTTANGGSSTNIVIGAAGLALPSAALILDDTWADGSRTNTSLPTDAAWYYSSNSGTLTATTGLMTLTTGTNAVLAVSYFTTNADSPVQLSVGDTLLTTITLSFNGVAAKNTSQGFRLGIYEFGSNRVGADFTGSGSQGAGVPGYALFQNMGATFNSTTPMDIRVRTNLTDTSLLGTTSDYKSLGTGPGNTNNFGGFANGTTYTLQYAFQRTANNVMAITVFWLDATNGATLLTSVTDNNATNFSFDGLAIRPQLASQAATNTIFQEIKVEYIPANAPP